MNLIWWGLTILLIFGLAALSFILVVGIVFFIVVSIVENIEARLGMVTIGDNEEALILHAEKVREEQRGAFKGPWTLTPQVKPYTSKVFRFLKAKEILKKK